MKNLLYRLALSLVLIILTGYNTKAQKSADLYQGGMKVKLSEDGSKYFRLISWAQMQAVYNDNAPTNTSNLSLNLRRARILMYSQISDKFLLVTHFGLNSLTSNSMSPTGTGAGSQLFLHAAWAQYNLHKNHSIGGGLHYFNGISRLNNQSTLNMMTMDNNRQSWSTLGLSDQFARHLGAFAKGSFGKLQYRVSINDALTNNLDTRTPTFGGDAVYAGKRLLGSKTTALAYTGYFEYNLLDQESNFLPYKVGTYLGSKKILNIGVGFFAHPNGSVIATDTIGGHEGQNVQLFAGDVFLELPVGSKGGAITAYATYQHNDYGDNYLYSAYGTGAMIYSHIGYTIPGASDKTRFQPYVSFANNSYTATNDDSNNIGAGINTYFYKHHSKLTLDFKNTQFGTVSSNTITIQAMIYL